MENANGTSNGRPNLRTWLFARDNRGRPSNPIFFGLWWAAVVVLLAGTIIIIFFIKFLDFLFGD